MDWKWKCVSCYISVVGMTNSSTRCNGHFAELWPNSFDVRMSKGVCDKKRFKNVMNGAHL